jgi:hypothetical protein
VTRQARGALIYFGPQHTIPTKETIGYPSLVGLDDGRVIVARLMRGTAPGLYSLMMLGPILEDVRVIWAAMLTGIVPAHEAQRLIRRADRRAAAGQVSSTRSRGG